MVVLIILKISREEYVNNKVNMNETDKLYLRVKGP